MLDALHRFLAPAGGIEKATATVLTLLGLLVLRIVFARLILRRTEDARAQYRWRKTISYTLFTVGALALASIWFPMLRGVSTFLGIAAAGLAVALQDPIVNLAGWAFIVWRRPFEVGDRVQVGEHKGDVIDQRVFQFTLMEIGNWVDADQSTGRVIHVPNAKVFRDATANFTKGFEFIWNEIPVLVTFESNWKKAREILFEIGVRHSAHLTEAAKERVRDAAKKYLIFFEHLTPTVYTSVRDCGVLLTIRYLCEPRKRRGTERDIWEDVLAGFATCDDVDFAYPTRRLYDNVAEGKPGARAPAGS